MLKFSNLILYYIRNVAMLFFSVYKNMWKTEASQQKSVFPFYKVIPSVGNIWGVSRLQADYTYPPFSVFTTWLESTDSHQNLSGCHCKCTAESCRACATAPGLGKEGSVCQPARFLCCSLLWCKDACMPATSAVVTHRLEGCHFKSDYPDITSVLKHLHLYKLNFNFCWLWWEVIFTHKLWKPCLFHLGFWIFRPK